MKQQISLEEIVKSEYRAYQIYTLMDRAIPHLQDGLKPGQRRILYTLWKNRSKGLMKVSSATGLVLTLHPHGPPSVESAIVNMAQDYTFANNYPLIDKKGYFGERMETAPAASRYIECKHGKIADLLLFDDLNQVEMVPNYDEKSLEPLALLPKLPLMLLNGAEGIGTGFSSVIPSFHHKDIIDSMIKFLETGKAKKLKPYVHHYKNEIEIDEKGRLIFSMSFSSKNDKIFITELPKGFDAAKLYKHLNRLMDEDYLKDYIDSSVNNDISVELVFKRGATPLLEEVEKKVGVTTSLVPNYTLISERGVKIFERPESIIEIFTQKRLEVVRKRYELLAAEYQQRILQNNEIIRFIQEKQYAVATKMKNRQSFVEHLQKAKFTFFDYLADLPIYRMTLEEVAKRAAMLKEDQKSLKEFQKIAKSPTLVQEKLVEELQMVNRQLNDWLKEKQQERLQLLKKISKEGITKKSTIH